MKKLLPYLFCFIFFAFGKSSSAQQDINFSQFYELPLLRNPALAGIFSGNIRFTSAYRNQWESITTPYRSMAFGTEIKVFKGLTDGDFFTVGCCYAFPLVSICTRKTNVTAENTGQRRVSKQW